MALTDQTHEFVVEISLLLSMNRKKNLKLNPLAKKAQKKRAKLAKRSRNVKNRDKNQPP